jgi:mono/diheme cytochrome c family protein
VLAAVLVLAGAVPGGAQTAEEGQAVYEQNCVSCHQPGGVGVAGAFPPLAGNSRVADPEYVAGIVRNGLQGPIEVLGQTYDGVMPAFAQLSDAEVAAVAAYVASLSGGTTPTTTPATTTPAGPVVGDPYRGEALFVGAERLSAGGAACFSCHAAGPYSQGVSRLGVDLTKAFSRLGGSAGLSAWLANPPSPTMMPIFATRPLTEDEIADLVAFLQVVDQVGASSPGPDWMLFGGLGGVGALMALMALGLRRPRGKYVDHLRSRA